MWRVSPQLQCSASPIALHASLAFTTNKGAEMSVPLGRMREMNEADTARGICNVRDRAQAEMVRTLVTWRTHRTNNERN